MTTNSQPCVRVGVGVFVLESTREATENPYFLIGKRLSAHGAGTYALPGGHLEFGEQLQECAAREVYEETGLVVKNVRFLTATNDFMPADNKHYVTMFMLCEREDQSFIPRVVQPEKCASWEWVSWSELQQWASSMDQESGSETMDRKLFLPLLNLVHQRPDVVLNSAL